MLLSTSYLELARTLQAGGVLSDPWLEGEPRFALQPLFLAPHRLSQLYRAAEAITAAHAELVHLCLRNPSWLDRLGLTHAQRLMWAAAAPRWHLVARADVFATARGPQVCELNSDTPSGEAEAVLLNAEALTRHPACVDPNATLEPRICRAVTELMTEGCPRGESIRVGIVYPTELTEDLSMIELYRLWFQRQGWQVILGSPYNLSTAADKRLALFQIPCDVIVRHYKTDWWGERRPVWKDETPYEDATPLTEPLTHLLRGALNSATAQVNPLGAVVTQNKRSMALLWEERQRLSPASCQAVATYLPFTARLETFHFATLCAQQKEWVLKSDYGCEGDEVVVGAEVAPALWKETLHRVIPERWIAQRHFQALRDREGNCVNHGVYVVAGRAAGVLARLASGATDRHATTAPVLLEVH